MTERILSIVIPVYNEDESLHPLLEELRKNLADLDELISDYEILFVDDGSSDRSPQIIKEMSETDPHIHGILFRKNFGKAAALQAAFRNAKGDIIITMDADLQDDPIELKNFIQKIDEGYDLVSGWKYNRLDPLEKRLPSKLFNKVTSTLSGVKLHDFNCGFKAYRKEVVKSVDVYGEFHRYIPVLAYRKGFRIAEITVHHNKRQFGKSKYGFERYLRGLFDSMTSSFLLKYADRPMYFFGKKGLTLSLLGIAAIIAQIVLGVAGKGFFGAWFLLGSMLILSGMFSFFFGYIANLLVDATYRNNYNEDHIKEKF